MPVEHPMPAVTESPMKTILACGGTGGTKASFALHPVRQIVRAIIERETERDTGARIFKTMITDVVFLL
jgi:hypothetical protein